MASGDRTARPVEPAIAQWLAYHWPAARPGVSTSELTELLLASRRLPEESIPDDVLVAWHRQLARDRRTVAQSEEEFIARTRRQGWADDRIAAVLGLDDTADLQAHVDALSRTHPSHGARPWTG